MNNICPLSKECSNCVYDYKLGIIKCESNINNLDLIIYLNWFNKITLEDKIKELKKLSETKPTEINNLIVKLMNKKQYISYTIYAAEQVIDIFEKKYPKDKRPRKAIEATIDYLNNPTKKNKEAAHAAAYAAEAAADAAYAAAYAAHAAEAAYAAYAAHAAANAAANAAYAAAYAAHAAEAAAAYAAHAAEAAAAAAYAAARKKLQIKILNYGFSLLEKGE